MAHELTVEFKLHDDTRVRVLDHCMCGTVEEVQTGVERAVAFAHWAAIEVFVAVDDGEFVHYENIAFAAFCQDLAKRVR